MSCSDIGDLIYAGISLERFFEEEWPTRVTVGYTESWSSVADWRGTYCCEVPADFHYRPSDEAAMRELYLNAWYRAVTGFSHADASAIIDYDSADVSGRYWVAEGGFYKGAIAMAIRTLHAFAEYVEGHEVAAGTCGISAGEVRRRLEGHDFGVRTNPIGTEDIPDWLPINTCDGDPLMNIILFNDGSVVPQVLTGASGTKNAWGYNNVVRLCEQNRMRAALADYYFWWATRLYSYAEREAEGLDRLNAHLVGMCCARAAMAEIAYLTGLLAHEMCHAIGGLSHLNHCRQVRYWVSIVPGLALPDLMSEAVDLTRPQDFCQSVVGVFVRDRVMAACGVPEEATWLESVDGDVDDVRTTNLDRFRRGANETWPHRYDYAPSGEPDFEVHLLATHCGLLKEGRRVEIAWEVPADCTTEDFQAVSDYDPELDAYVGSESFNTDDDACLDPNSPIDQEVVHPRWESPIEADCMVTCLAMGRDRDFCRRSCDPDVGADEHETPEWTYP